MKIVKFGVYIANLDPRFGTEPGKTRPVVVLQTDLLNNFHPSTIVCPITTKVIKGTSLLRVHLSKTETKLKKDSDILVDQLRAIDNKRFIRKVGMLNKQHREKLINCLKLIILE